MDCCICIPPPPPSRKDCPFLSAFSQCPNAVTPMSCPFGEGDSEPGCKTASGKGKPCWKGATPRSWSGENLLIRRKPSKPLLPCYCGLARIQAVCSTSRHSWVCEAGGCLGPLLSFNPCLFQISLSVCMCVFLRLRKWGRVHHGWHERTELACECGGGGRGDVS